MAEYYYVTSHEIYGRTYKMVQGFFPAKTFACRINDPYFGGFTSYENDTRSFEELQKAEWVSGLKVLCGGHSVVVVRGADLYRNEEEIYNLQELPDAITQEYDRKKITINYDVKKGKYVNHKDKPNQCCIIQ